MQAETDTVVHWSEERSMPLSLDKCVVMHCGSDETRHTYNIRGTPMPVVRSFTDLGVERPCDGRYSVQCQAVYAKASKVTGAIRRLF